MHFFFLFLSLTVNAAVLPRAPTNCQDEFEELEMDVFNDGPSVSGNAGIGAEFETFFFGFQNSACSLQDTFAAKRQTVQGRSGLNYLLSVDTGSLELGAGKLNPEYVLDGRNINVGDGSAAAAGTAIRDDFMNWTPWAETPPNQITIEDFPQCNPWTIVGLTPATDKAGMFWAPQITAPMPLEALYSLMKENVQKTGTNPDTDPNRNILNGAASVVTTGQNIQLVTKDYFVSPSLNIDTSTITDDILGLCTLVLSYAKAANLVHDPDVSPKHKIPFMPRTEFNTIYAQVRSKFEITLFDLQLFDIFNILACYKTDLNLQVSFDSDYCTGSQSDPVPGTKFAGLQYTYSGQGTPNPANPQTVNIKDWIQNIATGNSAPDLLSAFDQNYDSSIGGFNQATEKMFDSQRAVPMFEFRDLKAVQTSGFPTFMSNVDVTIQVLHQEFAAQPAMRVRVRRQSDGGSCALPSSASTSTGNPATPTTTGDPDCGNPGQTPCPTEPDCGPNLGQVPCPAPTPTPSPTTTGTSTLVKASATTIQLPGASATTCNDIEECDRLSNEARPSCQTAADCTAGCAQSLSNNTQALTVGFASTCVDQAFCTCSVEAAEIASEILIALGDIVCVVWNEAFQGAAAILEFIVPYLGEVAEGVDATELFEAANEVFKKGAKDCNIACPGHQYTAVDPMDINSMLGINECGGDEPTDSPGT